MQAFEEIEESTGTLLEYGIQCVFEGVQKDIKAHPGGIQGFCKDVGINPDTARCWWNAKHVSSIRLSGFITLLLVNPGTHTKSAISEVADVFAQHRKRVVERKLQKIRGQMAKVVEE